MVTLTLLAFIGLVWLREQILHGGGPEWLEMEIVAAAPANVDQPQEPRIFAVAAEGGDNLPAEPAPPEIIDNAAEAAPAPPGGAAANNNAAANNELNGAVGDDGQWNPMEWDRAAEELTWERLLGLDGSLVFLEHVFWVVSLNTLFILVFGKFDDLFHTYLA